MLQVWLRFEKRKEDGTVMKFRIQDLPSERIGEATDLMVKYFARDEPVRRAIGFIKNPEALEEYRNYVEATFRASRNVMCCADTDEDNPNIVGISSIAVASAVYWDLTAGKGTDEAKKISEMFYTVAHSYDVLKEFNLKTYYSDKSLLVLPEYRRNGIAEKFLTVRRLMCAAHGMPIAGAWMTNFATQIAATRDGWETLHEIPYEELSRRHGVTFEDVPSTIKLMVGRPHPDYAAVMSA